MEMETKKSIRAHYNRTMRSRMRRIVDKVAGPEVGTNLTARDWGFDTYNEVIYIPEDFNTPSLDIKRVTMDRFWREQVLIPSTRIIAKRRKLRAQEMEKVPMWVYNFYHELGHAMTMDENYFEETTLRGILSALAELEPELAFRGYCELPCETLANRWLLITFEDCNPFFDWWKLDGNVDNFQ